MSAQQPHTQRVGRADPGPLEDRRRERLPRVSTTVSARTSRHSVPIRDIGTILRVRRSAILLVLLISAWPAGTVHASASQPLSAQTVRYWTAVASCETGSGGPPKWDWGSKHRPGEGTLFEGGVGFSATVWQIWAGELGLLKRYPHAYEAPALIQMRVAEYGRTVHNAQWGCGGAAPAPSR